MNLDFWRSINYLFQDLIVIQLCLVTGYAFFIKKIISKKYYPIIYYLIVSVCIEIISKIMLKIDENSPYFTYLNFIFIPFELVMLYWFLNNIFVNVKHIKVWATTNFIIIIIFSIFELLQKEPNSKDVSLLSAILNIIFLLYILYQLNVRFAGRILYKTPEVIICFSFLIAFSILTIVFFILPKLIDYSRIMANQLLIFRHIINIIFYLLLGYGLNQKKHI